MISKIFVGIMYSGKTTKMLKAANKFKEYAYFTLKDQPDNRDKIFRNLQKAEVVVLVNSISDVVNSDEFKNYKNILIDEAHCYKDLNLLLTKFKDKNVMLAGLIDSTNMNKKWYKLFKYADEIIHCRGAKCDECDKVAKYSYYYGNNQYGAMCEEHFITNGGVYKL